MPVPALVNMFVWDYCYWKPSPSSSYISAKFYFVRQEGNKVHFLYSHMDDHQTLVYYTKENPTKQGADIVVNAAHKKRLSRGYSLMKENVMVPDVMTKFTFYQV